MVKLNENQVSVLESKIEEFVNAKNEVYNALLYIYEDEVLSDIKEIFIEEYGYPTDISDRDVLDIPAQFGATLEASIDECVSIVDERIVDRMENSYDVDKALDDNRIIRWLIEELYDDELISVNVLSAPNYGEHSDELPSYDDVIKAGEQVYDDVKGVENPFADDYTVGDVVQKYTDAFYDCLKEAGMDDPNMVDYLIDNTEDLVDFYYVNGLTAQLDENFAEQYQFDVAVSKNGLEEYVKSFNMLYSMYEDGYFDIQFEINESYLESLMLGEF